MAILIKRTFCISEFFRCSLVLLWFLLGLLPEIKKERKWEWNLNKSTFFKKVPEYYSGVMDKEKQKESISVGNALFEVVGWRVAYCAPRGGYWFNEKGFGTGFDI